MRVDHGAELGITDYLCADGSSPTAGAIHAAPPTGGAAPLTLALERLPIALARFFARYRQSLRIVIRGARSRRAAGREHARRHRWSVSGPIVLSRAENGERARGRI